MSKIIVILLFMISSKILQSQVIVFDYGSVRKSYDDYVNLYKKDAIDGYYFWMDEHKKSAFEDGTPILPMEDTSKLLLKIVPRATVKEIRTKDDTIFCSLKINVEKFPVLAAVRDTTGVRYKYQRLKGMDSLGTVIYDTLRLYWTIEKGDSLMTVTYDSGIDEDMQCYGFGNLEEIPLFMDDFNEYILISKGGYTFWRYKCGENVLYSSGITLESERTQFTNFLKSGLNDAYKDKHEFKFGFPHFNKINDTIYKKIPAH